MNFLSSSAVSLDFNPMAFVENLKYMGVGMLVIFAIIGIIILATKLVNYFFLNPEPAIRICGGDLKPFDYPVSIPIALIFFLKLWKVVV